MDSKNSYILKRRVTLIGTLINLVLSAIKYVIGFISGSSALIADATHSVSDYITDIAVLIGLKISSKPADKDHPYGHGKFETISVLIIGIALVIASGFLVYEGIKTIISGKTFVRGEYLWAIITAFVSVVVKEGLYRYTILYGRRLNSPSMIANAYHHRSDSYSSIGVLIGMTISFIFPELAFMDPLSGIVVAFFILQMSWKILKPTLHELVDTVPNDEIIMQISKIVEETNGVMSSSNIRSRAIGNAIIVDLEIQVDPAISLYQAHDISETVKENIIKLHPNVREVLVHAEPYQNIVKHTSSEKSELVKEIENHVNTFKEIKYINNIRFHYIPGGLELNLDIVVNPNLTVKEGHNISDSLEAELKKISNIKLVHIHLEFEKTSKT
ncbi:MAG: cation-efflux pump [Spirochaetota bacterium]|nr:cation-efflux pump [Spirochaetota bacterium]